MQVAEFMAEVERIYATGQATEHSYRAVLGQLFDSVDPDNVIAINEPKAHASGRPDFVFLRNQADGSQLTIGHCEAKDIGLDISGRGLKDANKNQWQRYTKALPNLIYTNCLDWHFYRDGELIRKIKIADYLMGIQPLPDHYDALANQLRDFTSERLQTITSAQDLAEMMAAKAALTKDILHNSLRQDEELQTELAGQFKAFKDQLIHDLNIEEFSDIYAETIAYGMFAARLHDDSLSTFSREEALELLPKSNPFLRNLFGYVAGPNLDESLRRTIDELAEIFQATDLQKLFENFGSFTQRNDPFIHFYETFLAVYNPKKRKARGVWYTPEPVVNFIVRAVDDVLKQEFGLADGLADTSRVTVDWDTGDTELVQKKRKGKTVTVSQPVIEKRQVHRVQILDPAAGTGTFLAEVIKQIAPRIQGIAPGGWSRYVEENLIPRLYGFELLMASYAMCHMKLDMMLSEMGYRPTEDAPRLRVYLTNSLEEGEREPKDLFMARWLSDEAQKANDVKRNVPIMCIIGNPPYSGESANKGDWIMGLMDAYKKEPGGREKLKERNPKWINDDYVKFIRFAEHMIERTGEGILGFITNHGYLDNPTFRGMRWHLLKTFDRIYVLDLHGNSKKKEVSPNGSPDKNVFDIMQGVALIIAVKKKQAGDELAKVFHGDLWGSRDAKYKALADSNLPHLFPNDLPNQAPRFPMVLRDFELEGAYKKGFGVSELMPVNSVGIVTARDALAIDMDRDVLWERVQDFVSLEPEEARIKYALGKDVRDWKVEWAQRDASKPLDPAKITPMAYRPFDTRWTYYTGKSRGFICYPRENVMRHMIEGNLGFAFTRTIEGSRGFYDVFMFNSQIAHHSLSMKEVNSLYPLYLYPDDTAEQADAFALTERTVNMDPEIRKQIEEAATGADGKVPDEVAIFDYIYGVLHSPAYRETYAEFLKIDFPRIPYPSSPEAFRDISGKGTALRKLHLMEDEAIGATPYPFEGEADEGEDSLVGKVDFMETGDGSGSVFINVKGKQAGGQYFTNVPKIAWEFFIGGYQPAQKWLKDRKGRVLDFDDIRHYQKIIKILTETDRIMTTIKIDLA